MIVYLCQLPKCHKRHLRPALGALRLTSQPKTHTLMAFVSWSVAPKSNPEDREFFTSDYHALEIAMDWSVNDHGAPMIIFRNDVKWVEITA